MEEFMKEKLKTIINEFVEENEKIEIPILTISPEVQKQQIKRLSELKQSRNQKDVDESLKNIKQAAVDGKNLMPVFLEAAKKYVTLGEMVSELKEVFGIYEETAVF
jgi:methylmalonyl-CoA mutase N-terminal domain/subunit